MQVSSRNTEKPSLEEKVAKLFFFGFQGTSSDDLDAIGRSAIELGVGGVILYGHNIESKEQVRRLLEYFKCKDRNILCAIDQEGGRVQRLSSKNGFSDYPSALELGQDPRLFAKISDMARDMRYVGVNMDFAPVVDVHKNSCPVIGALSRGFSADPKEIFDNAYEFMLRMSQFAILTSLKHFPGHGSSREDSHKNVTDITETWSEEELIPYKKMAQLKDRGDAPLLVKAHVIMTSHVINKNISGLPVTLSPEWIKGVLQQKIGYRGVVVSDDLMMRALDDFSTEEKIVSALRAGCTMLIISNYKTKDPITPEYGIEVVMRAMQDGRIPIGVIDQNYKLVMNIVKVLRQADESYNIAHISDKNPQIEGFYNNPEL